MPLAHNQDKLDGWGAIELYLGATRKAVLRRMYPLRYHLTGRVYAFKTELDAHDLDTNARKRPEINIENIG